MLSGAAVVCSLDRCQLLTTLSSRQMQEDYFLAQDLHRENRHFYYLGLFRYLNWERDLCIRVFNIVTASFSVKTKKSKRSSSIADPSMSSSFVT